MSEPSGDPPTPRSVTGRKVLLGALLIAGWIFQPMTYGRSWPIFLTIVVGYFGVVGVVAVPIRSILRSEQLAVNEGDRRRSWTNSFRLTSDPQRTHAAVLRAVEELGRPRRLPIVLPRWEVREEVATAVQLAYGVVPVLAEIVPRDEGTEVVLTISSLPGFVAHAAGDWAGSYRRAIRRLQAAIEVEVSAQA